MPQKRRRIYHDGIFKGVTTRRIPDDLIEDAEVITAGMERSVALNGEPTEDGDVGERGGEDEEVH